MKKDFQNDFLKFVYNALFKKTMENVRYLIFHNKILFMYSLQFFMFKKTVAILIFNSKSLAFFIIMSLFTFNSMYFLRKIIDRN